MLARKWHETKGISLPEEFEKSVTTLLGSVYEKECIHYSKEFRIHGEIYSDEIALAISLVSPKASHIIPITCFISSDVDSSSPDQDQSKILSDILDASGVVFDYCFAQNLDVEYNPDWEDISFKEKTYYYRIGRENIDLSKEADRLLGD